MLTATQLTRSSESCHTASAELTRFGGHFDVLVAEPRNSFPGGSNVDEVYSDRFGHCEAHRLRCLSPVQYFEEVHEQSAADCI